MIDLAVVGLGKMGLSHLAMIRPHPDVNVVAVVDSTKYVLDVLAKYTKVATYTDYTEMLARVHLDAVIIATPSALHAPMVRAALDKGLHVFCEKPLFLDPRVGGELTELARERGLVTQVGYHNKFVGTFREVKALLDLGAIGDVTTVLAEAYGPVVLKPTGRSWRSQRKSGGGCLYDYAAHPLDLLTWYLGEPSSVSGSHLVSIFSEEIDDAVTATLAYGQSCTASLNVNWSDESQRKMTTRVTLWGTQGRIYADRQEIQVYLREGAQLPEGYRAGWNVKYTTELTENTWFYLRGEEYSAQLDEFVRRVQARDLDGLNTFASASMTDRVIAQITRDAAGLADDPSLAGQEFPAPMAPRAARLRQTVARFGRATRRSAAKVGSATQRIAARGRKQGR